MKLDVTVGLALCGSFCTHQRILEELPALTAHYARVIPLLSENAAEMDTRFGTAAALREKLEELTGERVIADIPAAEPVGPQKLLDVLLIAPCTGNTLGKLAHGITDTAVTMAAKAHLRNDRPVVVAVSTNDGLSASAANLGTLLARKNYYFVPFGQDDPEKKPCSLIADYGRLIPAVDAALAGHQLQPLLLR